MKKSGLKLIVQIPAYNEQDSIGEVIKSIPRKIPGIEKVEVLVINDGSTDKTIEVSKQAGADYIISNIGNKGLAYTFQRGINEALKLGADIIVNTDADNQFEQKEIPKLIHPIVSGNAELVIGNREFRKRNGGNMPGIKKVGNLVASNIVSLVSEDLIEDASCGFRAYSRDATLRLLVLSHHTYTHETLIQALGNKIKAVQIPISVKPRKFGESRLIASKWTHTKKSLGTMTRTLLTYRPLKFFSNLGIALFSVGLFLYLRWMWYAYFGPRGDHLQSLLVGAVLIMLGSLSALLGFIAELLATNRRYLEEILYRIRKVELR